MKVNIKTTNIELDEALRVWVNEKIGELDRFLGIFAQDELLERGREKVEIWVEIGKTTKHHLKGDVFRAEAQLYLPKKSLRATAIDQDLRIAINTVKDELQRKIKRYKGRRLTRVRKWARRRKEGIRASAVPARERNRKILRFLKKRKK